MSTPEKQFRLQVVNGAIAGQIIPVKQAPLTIGRDPDNDIVIPGNSISKAHAKITPGVEGVMLEDLGSTSGTYHDNQRVDAPLLLRAGDVFKLGGEIVILVQQEPAPEEDTLADFAPPITLEPPVEAPRKSPLPPAVPPPTVAPYVPSVPAQQGRSPTFWVGLGVAATALVAGLLFALFYYFANGSPVVPPTPTAHFSEIGVVQTLPTKTGTPTVTPTATSFPSPSPTPMAEFTVGPPQNGIVAAVAESRELPQAVDLTVDPFCNEPLEAQNTESILVRWTERLASDNDIYLDQWFDNVYYDIRLNGRPIQDQWQLCYQLDELCETNTRCLDFWINLGLLDTGTHRLTLERYTTRELSTGLDVDPLDGEPDVIGPGLVGKGFCELIIVQAATPTFTPSPTAHATLTPSPTASATLTPISAPPPAPIAPPPPTSAPSLRYGPGVFLDFETSSTWKIGDQKHGQFTQSTAQMHGGSYAQQLSYDFPNVTDDFVVFRLVPARHLAGQPNAISAWVYGDNSKNYLNVWLQDAAGEIWQMTFGQIQHQGWQQLTAPINTSLAWPSGPISQAGNRGIDYPLSFYALVLDHISGSASSGAIYVDDLASTEGATVQPADTSQTKPPGQPSSSSGPPPFTIQVGKHLYEPWGYADDPCSERFNDLVPVKALNLELKLKNNTLPKIDDHWLPVFTSSKGKTVKVCPRYYSGSGPGTGQETSVTFFMLVAPDEHVSTVTLTLHGHTGTVCLDTSGASEPC